MNIGALGGAMIALSGARRCRNMMMMGGGLGGGNSNPKNNDEKDPKDNMWKQFFESFKNGLKVAFVILMLISIVGTAMIGLPLLFGWLVNLLFGPVVGFITGSLSLVVFWPLGFAITEVFEKKMTR